MSLEHNYTNQELEELYHGDQSKLYSGILGHHLDPKSAENKKGIKKIIEVTVILTIITVVEVILGLLADKMGHGAGRMALNVVFLCLTLVKAFFIVKIFMHLGQERKFFKKIVILPLLFLVWVIIAFLWEGNWYLKMNTTFGESNEIPAAQH